MTTMRVVGECFFWYRLTRVFPDKFHRAVKRLCVCVYLHLLRSMVLSLFNLHHWQSFSTISVQVFFSLPLGLAPSTWYSIHFFIQSLSSFCSTCPYDRNLFCCSHKIMSSNSSLSLNLLLGTLFCSLTPHTHLIILISARWSAISFSFLWARSHFYATYCFTCNSYYQWYILIVVSNGAHCLNLFHPIRILFSTDALASPSTLNMSHTLSLLIMSSSFSAVTTQSSTYNNSHCKLTLNSLDKASMTITNS